MMFPRDFYIETLTLVTQYISLQQKRYPFTVYFFQEIHYEIIWIDIIKAMD